VGRDAEAVGKPLWRDAWILSAVRNYGGLESHALSAPGVRTLFRTTQFFNNQEEAKQGRVEDLAKFDIGLDNGYVVSWALRQLLRALLLVQRKRWEHLWHKWSKRHVTNNRSLRGSEFEDC